VHRVSNAQSRWQPSGVASRPRVQSAGQSLVSYHLKSMVELTLSIYKYPPYPFGEIEIKKWTLASYSAPKFILCRVEREARLWGPEDVTPGFKTKTRCSLYVCPWSSCHTYGQNVNTENQCLYYMKIITRDIVFTQKTISTISSSSSGTHQSTGNRPGVTQASRRNLHRSSSSHLQILSSVTARVSRHMIATQQV
jgi:hypothetical protein